MRWPKPQRLWAVARKEFLHVGRDRRSLGLAVAIPMLMLVLFGWALSLDVDRVPLAVWDQDSSPDSRELVARFAGSRYFTVSPVTDGYREVNRALDTRAALAALVVPAGFGRSVGAGRAAAVQLLLDGSDANTATIAQGYAEAIVLQYGAGLVRARPVLDLRPRILFNEELQSRNYIVPGLVAVIMMVIAALLTSLTVAREWEHGSMEQLISTPVTGAELVLGKLAPYFLIGAVDVVLAVVAAVFLFGVPLRGSVLELAAQSALFLAGALSLGIFISVTTKSQLMASQLAMVLTFLPAFLLSGFTFPLENMPAPVRAVTHLVPARYFVRLLKGLFLKGVGAGVLTGEALMLALFAPAMVFLAVRSFRRKLD